MEMLLRLLIATVVAVGLAEGGVLSESLLKAFSSSPGEKKDVILEFNSVLENIIGDPSLSGMFGDERSNKIISLLQSRSKAMQEPILKTLSTFGIKEEQVTPFWISNKVAIKGAELGPLKLLSAVPGPFTIREAGKAKIFPVGEPVMVKRADEDGLQWGVKKVGAAQVWAEHCNGTGVRVAVIDTGLNANHEAIKGRYQNLNGTCSWKDGFDKYSEPHDGHGHGTHCAGSIAGDKNGIGVAPGATLMACRGLDDKGSGGEASLAGCAQWAACPCKDDTGKCTNIPHIVSNSWGGPGGLGNNWFDKEIKALRAVGIVIFFANGNSGPACFTVGNPAESKEEIIAVGSTDEDDKVSSFSSRGPTVGFSTKPDIGCPGRDIVSASHNDDTGYVKMSGTSMATPHAAGIGALILCTHPDWQGDKKDETVNNHKNVLTALTSTAYKPKINFLERPKYCTLFTDYPNNAYGHGRCDAAKAVNYTPK